MSPAFMVGEARLPLPFSWAVYCIAQRLRGWVLSGRNLYTEQLQQKKWEREGEKQREKEWERENEYECACVHLWALWALPALGHLVEVCARLQKGYGITLRWWQSRALHSVVAFAMWEITLDHSLSPNSIHYSVHHHYSCCVNSWLAGWPSPLYSATSQHWFLYISLPCLASEPCPAWPGPTPILCWGCKQYPNPGFHVQNLCWALYVFTFSHILYVPWGRD